MGEELNETLAEERVFEKTGDSIQVEIYYCHACGIAPISETSMEIIAGYESLEARYCQHCGKPVSAVRAHLKEVEE